MTGHPDLLRVVVADDESLARRMLTVLLARERDVVVVAESDNGPATIDAVRAHAPDVLFLDVRMPGATGVEVLEQLGPGAVRAAVLVTAFDDYAVAAFDHHALDYVLKPVHRARFNSAMDRVIALIRSGSGTNRGRLLAEAMERLSPAGSDRLAIRSGDRVLYLRVSDIDWIEAADDLVRLHIGKTVHDHRATMNQIEQRLPLSRFVRIHRSTIVNVERIREFQPWFQGE